MKNLMKIPVKKLDEGMRLCKDNIRQLLRDVDYLLEISSEWHAIAMAIFAYEELAKYDELKKAKSREDKYVDSNGEKYVEIDKRLFYDHGHKQKLAFKLIKDKESVKLLSKTELLNIGRKLDPKLEYFKAEEPKITPKLRLDCIFVDWNEKEKDGDEKKNDWSPRPPRTPEHIRRFKEAILRVLNDLVFTTQKSTSI